MSAVIWACVSGCATVFEVVPLIVGHHDTCMGFSGTRFSGAMCGSFSIFPLHCSSKLIETTNKYKTDGGSKIEFLNHFHRGAIYGYNT